MMEMDNDKLIQLYQVPQLQIKSSIPQHDIEDFEYIKYYDNMSANSLYSYFSQQDITKLNELALDPYYGSRPREKIRIMKELMEQRGFELIGGGTNRRAYKCKYDDRIVAKVAIDQIGLSNNKREIVNQEVLKPFCCKVFEISPCGTIAIIERVIPIKINEEFKKVAPQIFDILNLKIRIKNIGIEDIGMHSFKNWGVREGFGPVLLDYPTMYVMDSHKVYCCRSKPDGGICNGTLDYDDGFDNIVCTECGARYIPRVLAKKDGDKISQLIYSASNLDFTQYSNNLEGSESEMKIRFFNKQKGTVSNIDTSTNTSEVIQQVPTTFQQQTDDAKSILVPVSERTELKTEQEKTSNSKFKKDKPKIHICKKPTQMAVPDPKKSIQMFTTTKRSEPLTTEEAKQYEESCKMSCFIIHLDTRISNTDISVFQDFGLNLLKRIGYDPIKEWDKLIPFLTKFYPNMGDILMRIVNYLCSARMHANLDKTQVYEQMSTFRYDNIVNICDNVKFLFDIILTDIADYNAQSILDGTMKKAIIGHIDTFEYGMKPHCYRNEKERLQMLNNDTLIIIKDDYDVIVKINNNRADISSDEMPKNPVNDTERTSEDNADNVIEIEEADTTVITKESSKENVDTDKTVDSESVEEISKDITVIDVSYKDDNELLKIVDCDNEYTITVIELIGKLSSCSESEDNSSEVPYVNEQTKIKNYSKAAYNHVDLSDNLKVDETKETEFLTRFF